MKSPIPAAVLCFLALFHLVPMHAQVPHLITYQGRVTSGGQPFSGNGQFKFALVGNGGSPVYWRNDGTANPGEPAAAVTVAVSNGLFIVVLGDVALPGMAGFPPGIFNNSQVYLRTWFSDGVNGFAQLASDQRMTSVGYALMSDSVRDGAVTADKIAAGAIDASKLASGAAASNLLASGRSAVVSGAVVLSAQASASNLLAEGYVKIGQTTLGTQGWRALQNGPPLGALLALKRRDHVALWTGTEMIVWGGRDANNQYVSTGGRYNPASNTWVAISTNGAPQALDGQVGVWTGTQMLVWANTNGFGTAPRGGRYNPATDTWLPISTNNAPFNRTGHTAVWTGTYMIIWGGNSGFGYVNVGSRYNPATDTWTPVSTAGAPAIRGNHTATWTGSEMIIWGGIETHGCGFLCVSSTNYFDGARYNPVSDTWTPMTIGGAPLSRYSHSAVWNGSQMIVWGGIHGEGTFAIATNLKSGARYTPANNTWTAMTETGGPAGRNNHVALWTGTTMLIWGGTDPSAGSFFGDGSRYNPANNTWAAMTNSSAPPARVGQGAVWTGSEMLLWGGQETGVPPGSGTLVEIGRRYNPVNDTWTNMAPSGDTATRAGHTAVWTGNEMIVWGGTGGEYLLRTGGRLNPALGTNGSWTVLSITNAPTARVGHSAVWTGNEMLVWGGYDGSVGLSTGARYNPAANSWLPISTNGAPTPRGGHVAVWTGTEMVVWGGANGSTFHNTGGRYNPMTDSWQPLSTASAPLARADAAAVWTGSEMIVWGGGQTSGPPPVATLFNTGARYNPANNTWQTIATANAPTARSGHSAVWSGNQMVVWGGDTNNPDSGGRYDPAANAWTPLSVSGAPLARTAQRMVWDGTEAIVWGGNDGTNALASGAVYDPTTDLWTPTISTNAPTGRQRYASAWTGTEMIIHGGMRTIGGVDEYFDDTRGYVPARTMYLYLKP